MLTIRPLLRKTLATVTVGLSLATSSVLISADPAQAASYSQPLRTAISQLPVATEVRTGYDRTLFPHWKDDNGDCQNARAEVLITESSVSPTFTTSSRCTVATGRWYSYYDRVTWTQASDVDIDHVVALAEAWDSGARNWTTSRRQSFANDLGDSRSLIAVTDNVNQSKGDQDPATWLPTYDRCRFILEWTAVKIRWGLTVDSTEKNALTNVAAGCTNVPSPSTPSEPNGQPASASSSSSATTASCASAPTPPDGSPGPCAHRPRDESPAHATPRGCFRGAPMQISWLDGVHQTRHETDRTVGLELLAGHLEAERVEAAERGQGRRM